MCGGIGVGLGTDVLRGRSKEQAATRPERSLCLRVSFPAGCHGAGAATILDFVPDSGVSTRD